MSAPAGRARRAGFTLVEALVALIVAGLLLPVFAQAFAAAWSATRRPIETVSALALARTALSGTSPATAPGYVVSRSSVPLALDLLPSGIAPAPAGTGREANRTGDGSGSAPVAVPSAMRLAIPTSFGKPGPGGGAGASTPVLRRVSVSVRTPSGRRIVLDGVRLDAPRP